MKPLGAAVVMSLVLLCGCASGPPKREHGWWSQHVQEVRPELEPDGDMFYGKGENNLGASLESGDPLEFKWCRDVNGAPTWAIHVKPDGTGYVISYEIWPDGSVLRAAQRRLDVTLTPTELAALHQAVRESGALALRPSYGGGGEATWSLGLRAGGTLVGIRMNGGFPGEARRAVQGAWDVIVKPRAELLREAPRYKPEDWRNAPEFEPLR